MFAYSFYGKVELCTHSLFDHIYMYNKCFLHVDERAKKWYRYIVINLTHSITNKMK